MSNAELEKAKPALVSAIKAVNELNKDDITELKKVNNPVPAVELALRCTLIYLGYTKQDFDQDGSDFSTSGIGLTHKF